MLEALTIRNIAEKIEVRGIEFYEKLKDGTNDAIIDDIIKDEKQHIEDFHNLFNSNNEKYDTIAQPASYMDEDMLIEAYASTELFGKAMNNIDDYKAEDLYGVAIQMEKDSISFYSQLQELIGSDNKYSDEVELLDRLKREEGKHLGKFIELKNRVA